MAAVLVASLLAVLGVALSSGSASGAPSAAASTATPYPPGQCATLTISSTTAFPGEALTVGGVQFHAGDALTVILESQPIVLGHVTVGADGTFTTSVTLPLGVTGNHIITVTGTSVPVCAVDPIQISGSGVSAASTSASGGTSNGTSGGTAFTGVRILELVLIAAALLGAGVLLATSGRRNRRRAAGSHQR